MSAERSNKPLSEEDIKARDKNQLWAAGVVIGAAAVSMSSVGQAINNSLDNDSDLLTPESFSNKLDNLADENSKDKEIIDVILDGEKVVSFERLQQPFPEEDK